MPFLGCQWPFRRLRTSVSVRKLGEQGKAKSQDASTRHALSSGSDREPSWLAGRRISLDARRTITPGGVVAAASRDGSRSGEVDAALPSHRIPQKMLSWCEQKETTVSAKGDTL